MLERSKIRVCAAVVGDRRVGNTLPSLKLPLRLCRNRAKAQAGVGRFILIQVKNYYHQHSAKSQGKVAHCERSSAGSTYSLVAEAGTAESHARASDLAGHAEDREMNENRLDC